MSKVIETVKPADTKAAPVYAPVDLVHILQGRARQLDAWLDAFPHVDLGLLVGHMEGMNHVLTTLLQSIDAIKKQAKSEQPKAN